MRLLAAISTLAVAVCLAAPADAAPRFRLYGGTLGSGRDVTLVGGGLVPGSRPPVRLVVAGRRFAVAAPRVTALGHVRVTVTYSAEVAAALADTLGVVEGRIVVRRRSLPIAVAAVTLDPLALEVVPDAPVGFDEPLTLQAAGIAASGPPVAVRFTDCEGGEHELALSRSPAGGTLGVVLAAHAGARSVIDSTCFADLALEYAQVEFSIGETVGGSFHRVDSALAALLPPSGT